MPLGAGEVVNDDYWMRRVHFRNRLEMLNLAGRTTPIDAWIMDRVGLLPPGSYLARVAQPPLKEDMGLDVTYRSEQHVVLGLLGPEDVIDE